MDSRQKFKSSGKQSFQVADQSKQCKMAEKLMFIKMKMKTVRDICFNFSINKRNILLFQNVILENIAITV